MNENDYASRELCITLAGFGFHEKAYWAKSNYNGKWQIVPDLLYKNKEFHDEPGAGDFFDHTPAYSISELLAETSKRTDDITTTFMLGRATDNKRWSAVWNNRVCINEKAADAIANLLIQAIRAKEMKAIA